MSLTELSDTFSNAVETYPGGQRHTLNTIQRAQLQRWVKEVKACPTQRQALDAFVSSSLRDRSRLKLYKWHKIGKASGKWGNVRALKSLFSISLWRTAKQKLGSVRAFYAVAHLSGNLRAELETNGLLVTHCWIE